MTLSVIIPVYEVESTLQRCVGSVLRQGVADMEVILVDDGSPDHCPAICDRLAKEDNHIRVLHKENGGLSDARNAGLDAAKGEYVTFVDSDDWLEEDTYQPLMLWLKAHPDCDILEYSLRHIGGNRQPLPLHDAVFRSPRQYWEHTKAWEHAYAWNKIYRRRLFDNVRFPKGKVFEDIYTLPLLLTQNPRIATTSHGCYCYEWNASGISSQADTAADAIKQHLEALLLARKTMGTTPWSRNAWSLYRTILCRQLDIFHLTGEVVLRWPGVGLLCWWYEKKRRKGNENTAIG